MVSVCNIWRRVDHALEERHFSVYEARIVFFRQRDALLHDVWLIQRRLDGVAQFRMRGEIVKNCGLGFRVNQKTLMPQFGEYIGSAAPRVIPAFSITRV